MAELKLRDGNVVLVDDEDLEFLSKFSWKVDKNGYVSAVVGMHKLLNNGATQTDHKNHNKLDNRKENLRACTASQNHLNRTKLTSRKTTSRFKGVSWKKRDRRWRALIKVGGKEIHLGYFENELDAARAYNEAALKYAGEFACLNRLPEQE
jgi:hypothetical protein